MSVLGTQIYCILKSASIQEHGLASTNITGYFYPSLWTESTTLFNFDKSYLCFLIQSTMKNVLFIFAILVSLTACHKETEIKPMTQINQGAKYPGVYSALMTKYQDYIVPSGHADCPTTDNGIGHSTMLEKVGDYLYQLGENTPDTSDVQITYIINHPTSGAPKDTTKIKYFNVTYNFLQDGTTDWDGETIPFNGMGQPTNLTFR